VYSVEVTPLNYQRRLLSAIRPLTAALISPTVRTCVVSIVKDGPPGQANALRFSHGAHDSPAQAGEKMRALNNLLTCDARGNSSG
jgi:hypothetical protein